MSFTFSEEPCIKGFYSEDYGDTPEVNRSVVEVGDEVILVGNHLAFDNTDEEQGVFLLCPQGSLKLTEVSENRPNKIIAIIPDYVRTCTCSIEICTKNEEGCLLYATYDKQIHVKGYVDTYHMTKEDYWYNRGLKKGRAELADKLVAWFEEEVYKKPEVRLIKQESQKKVVVFKKQLEDSGLPRGFGMI